MFANFILIIYIYIYMEKDPTQCNDGERQTSSTEIERKFTLDPQSLRYITSSLPLEEQREITQAYLEITDEREVRVRKTEKDGQVSYECTVKTKIDDDANGLARGEVTEVITEEQFEEALKKHIGNIIKKTRLVFSLDDKHFSDEHLGDKPKLELDSYRDELEGLISAEIEFDSIEASEQFEVPDWLGQEVTNRKDFKNQQLALNGIPQDYLEWIKYLEK